MDMTDDQALHEAAQRCGQQLQAANRVLATAESCTGGWLAKLVTDVPGSSSWFDRGFVTYSNASKVEMLGVSEQTLSRHGAVSEAVVEEMALGALQRSQANLSVAISGVAGPGGGTPDKPVGLVCFAWGLDDRVVRIERQKFQGDREQVRCAAALYALNELCLVSSQ